MFLPVYEPQLLIYRTTRRATRRTDVVRPLDPHRPTVKDHFPRPFPFILLPLPTLRTPPPIPTTRPALRANDWFGARVPTLQNTASVMLDQFSCLLACQVVVERF